MFQTMAVARGNWLSMMAKMENPATGMGGSSLGCDTVTREQWLLPMGSSKARGPSVMDELLHMQQVSLQEELAGAGEAWPISLHRDRATVAAGQPWRRDQSHGLRLPEELRTPNPQELDSMSLVVPSQLRILWDSVLTLNSVPSVAAVGRAGLDSCTEGGLPQSEALWV